MITVIMAGGKGTRIQSITSDIPKPMISIEGKPVLEIEILSLRDQGYKDFIITISHLGSVISDYFGDGSRFGVNIQYYYEETPLGNAGALFKIKHLLREPFLLINADSVFDVDFNRFVSFHNQHNGLVTIFTHPNNHPYDSGLIIADRNGLVEEWLTKEDKRPAFYKNRVNAGIHIIDPIVLDAFDGTHIGEIDKDSGQIVKMDLDCQLLKPLSGTGKMFCYDSPEYVKDIGTPERLDQVKEDFVAGRVKSKNLSKKQKAVFLDRDGTINIYKGFIRKIEDFELISGVASAIKLINRLGYLVIVITNQPVIARGEVSYEELDMIHKKMETELGEEGAYIDSIYFCPHHPDKGFFGEVSELKFECNCRKPKPGMILKAAEDYNIDLSNSFMIGDSKNDIIAGVAAGCKTILIDNDRKNMNFEDLGQIDTVTSLSEFVEKHIL